MTPPEMRVGSIGIPRVALQAGNRTQILVDSPQIVFDQEIRVLLMQPIYP